MKVDELNVGDQFIFNTATPGTWEVTATDYEGDFSKVSVKRIDIPSSEIQWTQKTKTIILVTPPTTSDFELDVDVSPIGYHYTVKLFKPHESSLMAEHLNYGDSLGYDVLSITGTNDIIVTMRKAK